MAPPSLLRVVVTGSPGTGKSSVIKRVISHRFDNVPTQNAEFMGVASSGRHVSCQTVPPSLTNKPIAGPSQFLLEMQDQLHGYPMQMVQEPFWFEYSPGGSPEPVRAADKKKLESAAAAFSSAAGKEDTAELDMSRGDHIESWSANRKGGPPRAKHALPEEPGPHPLQEHIIAQNARDAGVKAIDDTGMVSPLTEPHGAHGWVMVFDLGSRASFEQAQQLITQLLDRVGFDRLGKASCPIVLMLVGNKYDKFGGAHAAVSLREMCEFLAQSIMGGALLGQLKKHKVDVPLRKLCDALVQQHKTIEMASALAGKSNNKRPGPAVSFAQGDSSGPGAAASLGDDSPPQQRTSVARSSVRSSITSNPGDRLSVSAGSSTESAPAQTHKDTSMSKFTLATGMDEDQFHCVLRLRAALDPVRVASSHCTDLDILIAVLALLRTPNAQSFEMPASEMLERFMACSALSVKYIETSCKTNYQLRIFEHILSRSLKLLPTQQAGLHEKSGGPPRSQDGANLLDSIGAFFGNGWNPFGGNEGAPPRPK